MMLLVMAVAAPAWANQARVELRGGEGEVQGRLALIDSAGVTIHTTGGERKEIIWDRVRDVVPIEPDARLDEWLPVAEDLWRARSRLQRHDARTAEPLFERLFERYRGQTNEVALIVAEGLLRCRLARQANEQAVVPFLEVVRLRRAGLETDRYANLPGVIDEGLELAPGLPPVWTVPMLLPGLERDLARVVEDSDVDEVVRAMAALYRIAVRDAMTKDDVASGSAMDVIRAAEDHAGVRLLREVVAIQIEGESPRRMGRNVRSRRAADERPDWAGAWITFAEGMYRITHAESLDEQLRGCVRLLRVPAAHGRSQPYLAGLALHRTAQWHEQQGKHEAARPIREALEAQYPHHPVHHITNETASCAPSPSYRLAVSF